MWPKMYCLQPVVPPLPILPRLHGEGVVSETDVPPHHQPMTRATCRDGDTDRGVGPARGELGITEIKAGHLHRLGQQLHLLRNFNLFHVKVPH